MPGTSEQSGNMPNPTPALPCEQGREAGLNPASDDRNRLSVLRARDGEDRRSARHAWVYSPFFSLPNAPGAEPKSPLAWAAIQATAAYTATFWPSSSRLILSRVSLAV